MRYALVSLALAACSSGNDRAPQMQSSEPVSSSEPVDSAPVVVAGATATSSAPVAPTTITVAEGTPETLPDGTSIAISKVMYAHLKDSKNLSMCEVTIKRGGKTETKTLEREGPIVFVQMAGLRVGLDGVDPYHQPSKAFLVIEP